MFGILGILVLWALIAPIVALVVASRATRADAAIVRRLHALEARIAAGPLEDRLRELALRVAALEARLAGATAASQAPASAEIVPDGSAPPAAEQAAPAEPAPQPSIEPVGDARGEPETLRTEPETFEAEPGAGPWMPGPAASTAGADAGRLDTLEGQIGGRWSVLVGGLALALGAVFLVRYSIEQGLLGPGMRVALGSLLAVALLGLGEVLRRRDRALNIPALANADVPAILTGAGAVAAFATIYAAYALYGFVGDAAAFVMLTAAGLATLLLSVIHGPALAALGVLGSYAAPLLVSSAEPKPFPVVLHTLIVTAAVLAMARIRNWRWLAIAGVVASLVWGVLVGLIENVNSAAAQLLLLAGLTAIYVASLIAGSEPAALRDRAPNILGLASLAGIAALSVYFVHTNAPVYPPLVSGIVLVGAFGAVASRWTAAAGAVGIAGILAVVTVMILPAPASEPLEWMRLGALQWRILGPEGLGAFALKAAAIALVVGLGGFWSAERAAAPAPRTAGLFAAAGAAAPLLILLVVYLRHVPFETRPVIGLAALVLAAIFAGITERLIARRPDDDGAPAPACYATGAVLALALAIGVGLWTQLIPLALALAAVGIVWVSLHRPVRILPWLAVLSAVLACAALVFGPSLSPDEIGTRPILNGLVHRFGLPAAALLVAGEMLRRYRDGLEAGLLQALGLAVAALFIVLEIRHFANSGVLDAGVPGLGEQSAYTMAALAFSLGLQRIGTQTDSRIYRAASLVAGGLGAAQIALAHLITANPVLTNDPMGQGVLFNLLLPGYLLPALLAAWMAAAARGVRPRWYVLLMAALALGLGFAYVTLVVRHAFQGPRLGVLSVRDAENWTYSAVWLAFGIGLLLAGLWRRSVTVRAASGLVIAAVVCKVFLLDMAALTGVLRAASFLGLGGVLIVVGRLYQRLLTHGSRELPPSAAEA